MDEKWMNKHLMRKAQLMTANSVFGIPKGKTGHAVVAHARNEDVFVTNDLLSF
jgi:hypothetical protein